MDNWYQERDMEKCLTSYKTNEDSEEIANLLAENQNWFLSHDINFTPCLFVNGYKYPKEYDIADLPFFIDELIDDKTYNDKNIILRNSGAEKLEESRQ